MLKTFEAVAQNGVIRLPADVPSTAHCVVTVLEDDLETLQGLADSELPSSKQQRMSELLRKNRDGTLTPGESIELDELAAIFDAATLTKGSALAALAQLNGNSQP